MGKKKKTSFGSMKTSEVERGYTIMRLDTGKRAYVISHPDGLPKDEAERLSEGLAIETKVVPIDQVG